MVALKESLQHFGTHCSGLCIQICAVEPSLHLSCSSELDPSTYGYNLTIEWELTPLDCTLVADVKQYRITFNQYHAALPYLINIPAKSVRWSKQMCVILNCVSFYIEVSIYLMLSANHKRSIVLHKVCTLQHYKHQLSFQPF